MKKLALSLIDALDQPSTVEQRLSEVGEPDPPRARIALSRALAHADLEPARIDWLAALLSSARPGTGAERLVEIADRYRRTQQRALRIAAMPGLPRVLGSSDFLARLLLRHPGWCDELAGEPPAAPDESQVEADWTAIRISKYRGLLRIAARDLMGRPFGESPGELARLADRCLDAASRCTARETEIEAPALFSLGKLGGSELNFSSDVDLLFIYHASPAADLARNRELARFVQHLKRNLEAPSEDGFGYRVDLDLRPEGRSGALANSVDAALTYYETFGADWERQMLIRLRWVAGPIELAADFSQAIIPFVYRQLIDPAAIGEVRAMKARIEAERRKAGRDLEADLKNGPGGIRDVEFLVQALQLFHGGRRRELRTGNASDALGALARLHILPEAVASELQSAYLWLRRAEHCAQLIEERQTHQFPRKPEQQNALARRMGYADTRVDDARTRLLDDWTAVRAEVRAQFQQLVLEPRND